MDYLLGLLNQLIGDQALARLLFIGGIGLSTVLLAITLALLLMGLQDPVPPSPPCRSTGPYACCCQR
jgi:tight adherence protein C